MLKYVLVATAFFLLPVLGLGQDNHYDVSVNYTGVFNSGTSGNSVTRDATSSGGGLFSFRWRFNADNALAFSYGRFKDSQKFNAPPFDFRVITNVTEFTAVYMYSPYHKGNVEGFVLGGGGVLMFKPGDVFVDSNVNPTPINQQTQTRPTFLYGAGVDYKLSGRWSVRLQYRGMFYSSPDFRVSTLFTGGHGHTAEPSFGLVYKF